MSSLRSRLLAYGGAGGAAQAHAAHACDGAYRDPVRTMRPIEIALLRKTFSFVVQIRDSGVIRTRTAVGLRPD